MKTEAQAPLYLTDDELRDRINPKIGQKAFRELLRVAEREGFPKKSELWRGRYWPKVKAWLDKDNRLDEHDAVAMAEDGQENFNAPTRRNTRPETQPSRQAILERAPSGPQHARLPRPVHSASR